jgi:hypothetical protein
MMKKLTLNLDALEVESFAVAGAREDARGAEAFLTGPANCVTVSCGDSEIRACFGF